MDFFVVILCLFALLFSLWSLVAARCSHVYWNCYSMRCISCGIARRQLLIKGRLPRLVRYSDQLGPYADLYKWIQYRVVQVDEDCWKQEEFVGDDTPKEIREKFDQMMQRRAGISWYWRRS